MWCRKFEVQGGKKRIAQYVAWLNTTAAMQAAAIGRVDKETMPGGDSDY